MVTINIKGVIKIINKYTVTILVLVLCLVSVYATTPQYEEIPCMEIGEDVTVPFEALHRHNNRDYIWIKNGDSFVCTEVETGENINLRTKITNGASCGDIVVICPDWEFGKEAEIHNENR